MLSIVMFVLCILGLCGVVTVKPICIIGIIYTIIVFIYDCCRKVANNDL